LAAGSTMNTDTPDTTTDARIGASVVCPRCSAHLAFRRSLHPHIDACGFESYALECTNCGASLAGVIDPADETLLLSEVTP